MRRNSIRFKHTHSERGFALIAVMLIGAAAMYAVTGLLGDGTVVERRLQDEELLKMRAYWAGQGHISYAISRSIQTPPCGGECKNAVQWRRHIRDIFDELNEGTSSRDWSYPEISTNYQFPVQLNIVSQFPKMEAQVTYPDFVSTIPIIDQTWPARRDYSVFLCIGMPTPGVCPDTGTLDNSSGLSAISRMAPL